MFDSRLNSKDRQDVDSPGRDSFSKGANLTQVSGWDQQNIHIGSRHLNNNDHIMFNNAKEYQAEPGNVVAYHQHYHRQLNTSHDLPNQYRSMYSNSTGPSRQMVHIPIGLSSQQELRNTNPNKNF